MDKLLSPDFGLMFWTIATFLVLVAVLKPTAWDPLIKSLREREEGIRAEKEAALMARQEAERLKAELEREFQQIQMRTRELLSQAQQQGAVLKEEALKNAQEEIKKMMEKAHLQLEEETARAMQELRREVAGISVAAAEKILKRSIDQAVQKTLLEEFFRDLDKMGSSKQVH